jgi:hypothetical protein
MKKLDIGGRIEHVQTLFAELKAIAVWNGDYWRRRHHDLGEIVAHVSRCRRKVEILSEVVAIVTAMYCEKSASRRRGPLTRKGRKGSFLKMV